MQLVTISLRLPKAVNDQLEAYAVEKGYATKTEVLRDWIRTELAKTEISKLRGALKGQGIKMPESMTEWRKADWKRMLKEAGGDEKKALKMLQDDADAVARELGLQ